MKRWAKLREKLGKDIGLLAALGGVALVCLLLGFSSTPPTSATEEELRLSRVLSAISGAGSVEVAVFHESTDTEAGVSRPCGAVIVADGAGDIAVRLALSRAASTLLGLAESQIEIFRLEEGTP